MVRLLVRPLESSLEVYVGRVRVGTDSFGELLQRDETGILEAFIACLVDWHDWFGVDIFRVLQVDGSSDIRMSVLLSFDVLLRGEDVVVFVVVRRVVGRLSSLHLLLVVLLQRRYVLLLSVIRIVALLLVKLIDHSVVVVNILSLELSRLQPFELVSLVPITHKSKL